jgi:hypothetical protein
MDWEGVLLQEVGGKLKMFGLVLEILEFGNVLRLEQSGHHGRRGWRGVELWMKVTTGLGCAPRCHNT